MKYDIIDEETKSELKNIAENIWAAKITIEGLVSKGTTSESFNKPLIKALENHFKYLMSKSK